MPTWVSATTGLVGRSRATADAVRPVNVGTRIAFAPSASARSQAAFDMARPTVGSSAAPGSWCRYPRLGSTARAMRAIVSTASTGYAPTAVSAESMIAEVPSRIALATSDASARVGSGRWTIVSSIWVAVIAGFPRSSAARMIRFCSSGTSATPISTPRSPRAIMTPSASSRISSSAATASFSSIFAMSQACDPASSTFARSPATSARERTNDCAT
jgi:hypothetical protein